MGLAKKVVHIKSKTLFSLRNLPNINISSTITIKTTDYRKQHKAMVNRSKRALPIALKLPKSEKGKQSYSGNEQSRRGRSQGIREAECRGL